MFSSYQSFDQVSSIVTTKVKGQGFIPTNSTLITKAKDESDIDFYNRLFTYNLNSDLQILDTAGRASF